MAINVSSENNSFKLQRMYQISMTTSGWKLGKDYTLALRVTDASGAERRVELGSTVEGKGQAWENTRLSCLFVLGDTVSVTATPDAEYTVTEEDLGLTGDFSKSTIYHFENNVYDRAGIYLNINPKGYKNMAAGDTFELNSFRNWFAIESYMNAEVALPEMH